MMKRMLCGALLLLLGAGLAVAQSKTGTTVGTFLMIEPSARIAAMGNAGATMVQEIESAYYNPAAIGMFAGNGVQFTHSPWLADITYDYAGLALTLGDFGNLYASVTSLNSGDIDVRTVQQPLGTGEKYTVSDLALGIGYGRMISEHFSVGIEVSYLQETIWHSSMNALFLNVGTLYRISPEGLHIGASVSNVGTRGRFDGRDIRVFYDQNTQAYGDNGSLPAQLTTDDFPLPIFFRVGVGMPFTFGEQHKLFVAVDAYHPSDNTENVNVGAEWMFFNIFALRAGYQRVFKPHDAQVGLTLGAGLQYDAGDVKVMFDYGWADANLLEKTQRMTLGVSF